MATSWQCPYCNHHATLLTHNLAENNYDFDNGNKDGRVRMKALATICPNPDCREYTISVSLYKWKPVGPSSQNLESLPYSHWMVKPQSLAKPFPDYVPAPILEDYEEACSILTLSPKASATLSRRCLQGMIRDYWGISKARLVEEITAIKDKIEPQTWAAIDAVRNIGNIGAHMEKDINVIVEVDPQEATLLCRLIETLIDEWYVRRHERGKQLEAIVAVAQAKKEQQQPIAPVRKPDVTQ